MPIILFASSMLLSTILATKRQRSIGRENAIAVEACRSVIEQMRNEDFDQVVVLYNPEPMDDPAGPGTAPGHRFAIPGLRPAPDSPDGMIGEVVLPFRDLSTGPLPDWQLREDLADEDLGMPRDLDGDFQIDDVDHTNDYRILPVRVEAAWEGELGVRRFRIFTVLMEFEV